MAWKTFRARLIDALISMENEMSLDTSKLLAAVAQEKTDNASLRALVAANTAAFQQVSQQLQTANATIAQLQALATGGDTAALQQQITDLQNQLAAAQADVDKATSDLSTDNAATEAAITANTPAAGISSAGATGTAGTTDPNAASASGT